MDRQLIEDQVNNTSQGVLQTLNSPSPSSPATTGIQPVSDGSMRDLIQPAAPPTPPTTPATPASQTSQQPPSATNTAPVVSAPVLSTVDADKETVAGQLRTLLAADSPILKQARDRSQIVAASRGLQNSTLAAQAGEEAVIGAAVPIAGADAQTYAQRNIINTQAQNVFGQAQQQFEQNRVLQQDASAQRQVEQALAGDINSRLQLEQAGYNFQLSVQDNLNKLRQIAATGDINAKLALQQFDYQSMLMDKEAGNAITLEDKRFQNSQSLMLSEYAQRLNLSEADNQQQQERMNLQHQQVLEQLTAQAQNTGLANAQQYARDLQSAYLTSITNRQNSASQEIQQIYSTQGLNSTQQNSAVTNAYARMQADIRAIGAYFQQSPYWDPGFGAPGSPAPAGGATPPTLPPGTGYVPPPTIPNPGSGVPGTTPFDPYPPGPLPGGAVFIPGLNDMGSRGRGSPRSVAK